MNRFIQLDSNGVVVSVRYGNEIVEGEILSDSGECGQVMQADGTFVPPDPPRLELSTEEYLIDLDYRLSLLELGL